MHWEAPPSAAAIQANPNVATHAAIAPATAPLFLIEIIYLHMVGIFPIILKQICYNLSLRIVLN